MLAILKTFRFAGIGIRLAYRLPYLRRQCTDVTNRFKGERVWQRQLDIWMYRLLGEIGSMNDQDLEHYRKLLVTMKGSVRGDVEMLTAESLSEESGIATGGYPTHPADIGTESYDQEFTLELLENRGNRLDSIEAALARISSGEYGACMQCGGRIAKARLDVLPDTPYCVKCAQQLQG